MIKLALYKLTVKQLLHIYHWWTWSAWRFIQHFAKPQIIYLNLSPLITSCQLSKQGTHTHTHTQNISFPKQAVRLAVMKKDSTAFRCRCADVCWQALPSPVYKNTAKSALLSGLSQPWKTAEADWQDLEQCLGSTAKTQTTAARISPRERERWLFTLHQVQMSQRICLHQMHGVCRCLCVGKSLQWLFKSANSHLYHQPNIFHTCMYWMNT